MRWFFWFLTLIENEGNKQEQTKEFEERKNYITKRLNEIPNLKCFNPQGAFYVFPNISKFFGKTYNGKGIESSVDLTEYLLEEAKVAVVPGVEFGSDDHVRISYAVSMEDIKKGIDRIEEAIEKLNWTDNPSRLEDFLSCIK